MDVEIAWVLYGSVCDELYIFTHLHNAVWLPLLLFGSTFGLYILEKVEAEVTILKPLLFPNDS